MLDKTEVPYIPEGYPLVLAMNALLDAIKSVSLIVNDAAAPTTSTSTSTDASPAHQTAQLNGKVKAGSQYDVDVTLVTLATVAATFSTWYATLVTLE